MTPQSIPVKSRFENEGTVSTVVDIMLSYLMLGILISAQYAVDRVEEAYVRIADRPEVLGRSNMGKINSARVILGGLLAGLIINIAEGVTNGGILGGEWKAWAERVGAHQPSGGQAMALWTCLAFALGLLSVWMYAAVRPRFGAGPKTAILIALVMWVIYWPLVAVQHLALGTVPGSLLWMGSIGGLIGMVAAMLAGAAVYKEQG